MDKTAKQRLASYRALRLEVDNQLDRLARLRNEEQLPAMRESSGAKSTGGNGDRMERAILLCLVWGRGCYCSPRDTFRH